MSAGANRRNTNEIGSVVSVLLIHSLGPFFGSGLIFNFAEFTFID